MATRAIKCTSGGPLLLVTLSIFAAACSLRVTELNPGDASGDGSDFDGGRDGGPDAASDAATDATVPCGATACTAGKRCAVVDGGELCVDNECADLDCSATERCSPHPQGGNYCEDIFCTSDVQCTEAEYCDGTICVPDVCSPDATRCSGADLVGCASNGGGETTLYSCGGASNFTSQCVDDGVGGAGCSCQGDWDCPEFTACIVGTCIGTGSAPTCRLPPVPFSSVPPTVEFHWGGDSRANAAAHDGTPAANPAPWPAFSHSVSTPIVANLDDDNGDGLINELDFPEIIFTTHNGDNPWGNGVVRAIHGGGSRKGADYFARCGNKLWTEAAPSAAGCGNTEPDGNAGAPVAVADLDGDGTPEIVYMTENNLFRILDNTGALLLTLPTALRWSPTTVGETVNVANLDQQGPAELLVGRAVYLLQKNAMGQWSVTHFLEGAAGQGTNERTGGVSRMACPADLSPTFPGLEIVAGGTLYRLPTPLPSCGAPPCTGTLPVVWDATTLGGQSARLSGEGFCAVADIWGANRTSPPGPANPPDGNPEVILIDDGDLTILDAATGIIIDDRNLGGGRRGGAPNVDDFDGDGFMEVATALQDFYAVVDLQAPTAAAGNCPAWPATIARRDAPSGAHNPNSPRNPGGTCSIDAQCNVDAVCNVTLGQCVCLHNGWERDSDDDSSRATSSSVFDFNGDGAAEVLYNDECDFRVYDGSNGEVLFSAISRSRTGIENPVVADVDNDGNAEVVVGMNTAQGGRCDEDGANPIGPNGLHVWGDSTDTWVSARRIWNEQSYHVTNITEGAVVPVFEPENWRSLNGRFYNTYRSQPRSFGIAPDLVLADVGISSPDAQCGTLSDLIDVTYEVKNQGDLRVGPGVTVQLFGTWSGAEEPLLDGTGAPLEETLSVTLEPGGSRFLSNRYDRAWNGNGRLPDSVRIVVDPARPGAPNGAERECDEDNNEGVRVVDPGDALADLVIALGTTTLACPSVRVAAVITNQGTQPATDVLVRLFAGDPSGGGTPIHNEVISGVLGPSDSRATTFTISPFPTNRQITVYGVVDPAGVIPECNKANNVDTADHTAFCSGLI